MIIREANKFDVNEIIEMLKLFRNQAPIEEITQCNNIEYISQVIHHILIGRGVLLVAEKENKLVGMIIGYIHNSVWDPEMLILNELAFYVKPEYRGTSAGYRLLKKYNETVKQLKDMGRIKLYTLSKMVNSPDLDYGRFGYKKVEEHWVGGM